MDIDPNKQYQIEIVAVNDADYNMRTSRICASELKKLIPLIEKVRVNKGQWNTLPTEDGKASHPMKMYSISEEEFESLNKHLPVYEDWGYHTIEKIEVREWIEFPWIKLL